MEVKVGDIIEGTVIELRPYGSILIFDDETKGLLHISEISNIYIKNLKRFMHIGRTYQVKVVSIAEDGFLRVSMTKISDQEKEEYRTKKDRKVHIDPSEIDFTALKEHLKTWEEELQSLSENKENK